MVQKEEGAVIRELLVVVVVEEETLLNYKKAGKGRFCEAVSILVVSVPVSDNHGTIDAKELNVAMRYCCCS
ncbi:hypothetical protein LR48_Vigan09g206000 [Vigna angularis]|uniref:Uncharacterized protein n=1 Tax=Phaseolus angularis TaxID=3914 RepID=A0A0L9VEB3_PHAAN|nr:uncharacterized protein HKW66_Vig0069280 [Vigna angularis]KOM53401.1 hypothetical protein LR48_Vigan09g206000 [Vigna angularis]